MSTITLVPDATDTAIADWVEAQLRTALAQTDGTVALALPGGATPFPILALLTARDIEWDRVVVFPTDDRLVPQDHPASNTGKLRALLEPLGADVCGLEGVRLTDRGASLPWFTLVWLGMGADGHVASLFPNTDPAPDDSKWVRRLTPDPLPPEAPFDRITLTIPALIYSGEVMFVIRGEDKRAVFEAAMRGEHDLPVARLLAACDAPVTCFT